MPVYALLIVALVLGICCTPTDPIPAEAPGDPFAAYEWVDLSHAYDAETVFWPTGIPFEHVETAFGMSEGGYFYSSYDLTTSEHSGTHLDAPIHFAEGKAAVDELDLERLAGPVVVIDVTAHALENRDYLVTAADIEAAEAADGEIQAGSIVLARTDWSKRWPDRKAYLGDDTVGTADNLHFPRLWPRGGATAGGARRQSDRHRHREHRPWPIDRLHDPPGDGRGLDLRAGELDAA